MNNNTLEGKKANLESEIKKLEDKKGLCELRNKNLVEDGKAKSLIMTNEAKAKSDKLIEQAETIKKEADNYSKSIHNEVKSKLSEANNTLLKGQELKAKSEKEIDEALKIKSDSKEGTRIAKEESDKAMAEALKINDFVGKFRIELDERKSKLDIRESSIGSKERNLDIKENNIKSREEVLKDDLQKAEDLKNEVLGMLDEKKKILKDIEDKLEKIQEEKNKVQEILDDTLKKMKDVTSIQDQTKVELNSLAKAKEDLQIKEIEDKERQRSMASKSRELDEKMETIKKMLIEKKND